MLFGAVATGIMKAQLALIAAGIINSLGSIFDPIAVAASTGINNTVLAVLLVVSVRKVTPRQMAKIISIIGKLDRSERLSAITVLNPDTPNALAKQMPPPNNKRMPHGMVDAVSQSSNLSPLALSFPAGITNMSMTAINATDASLALGNPNQ